MVFSPSISIQLARPEDRDLLIKLFLRLLKALDRYDHDMLPTVNNAEWMVDQMFMPAAARGEAILIAWDGEMPVGALFWPIQHLPYDVRWKTAFGYGTYVDEGYRKQNVSRLLRDKATEILKGHGVKKLMGMVILKNEVSVKASDRYGFVPFARIDLLDI